MEILMTSYDNRLVSSRMERFRAEVLLGLSKPQKELPSKYFYDEEGSRLFDLICDLEEYYIPDVETGIMSEYIREIAELIGPNAFIIEYGSGSCKKIRFLLDNLHNPAAYAPIDISREQLLQVSERLALDYPHVEMLPVCADYTSHLELPIPQKHCRRIIGYFPGSTIGNFDPVPATKFLDNVARICGEDGGMLIGVDLRKDPALLHRAYNDRRGITASFNLNLLARLNRELGSDFQLDSFEHYAFYNPRKGRVEMHLVSLRDQEVHFDQTKILFCKGESIWTESSYKFSLNGFRQMAMSAGFDVHSVWTDDQNRFSVQYLRLNSR